MIHHTLFHKSEKKAYEERLTRTQLLFKAYYGCEMPISLREIEGLPVLNPKNTTKTSRNYSSIVGTRDDEIIFWDSSEEDDDDDEKENSRYFPWLPSCDCFGVFGGDGSHLSGRMYSEEDIYAVKEDVSLLTPPGSLADE
jgi:hypothetical protein